METTPATMPPIYLTPDEKKTLTRLGNGLPQKWAAEQYATELINRGGFIPVRDYLLSLYRKTAGPLVTDKQVPSAEIRQRVERTIPKTARRVVVHPELDPLQRWMVRHFPNHALTCAGCGNPLNIGQSYQVTSKDDLIHTTCKAA